MGILDRLFGKKQEAPTEIKDQPPVECPHGSLGPHWDNVADFGKRDLIAFYVCEACGTRFGREEGEAAMAKAADTVKVDMSVRGQVKDAEEAKTASGEQQET